MESSAPIAIADYAEHETNEVDVRNLFEQGPAAPAAPREYAVAAEPQAFDEPEPPPIEQKATPAPIDLLANDGVDADVLDDDAFFATLRDAVHDEAPLGPREDDEERFFDQDADKGSFRDVFRRRR
jgi:hypothetical protein